MADPVNGKRRHEIFAAEHGDAQHRRAAQAIVHVDQTDDVDSPHCAKDLDHDFRVAAGAESNHLRHAGRSWKRFVMNAWSSATAASVDAIRSEAWPSPYGLRKPPSDARNAGVSARPMPSKIAPRSAVTSITFSARNRPFWRSPIFTTGNSNDGASIIPLEELPTITDASFIRLKYASDPSVSTNHVEGRLAANAFRRS